MVFESGVSTAKILEKNGIWERKFSVIRIHQTFHPEGSLKIIEYLVGFKQHGLALTGQQVEIVVAEKTVCFGADLYVFGEFVAVQHELIALVDLLCFQVDLCFG